jgi:hypothetical protein
MTPIKRVRTTLVSAIFKEFGCCFGRFDMYFLTNFNRSKSQKIGKPHNLKV